MVAGGRGETQVRGEPSWPARSAGTHEGYQAPTEADAVPSIKWVWRRLPTRRPWPLDLVEPDPTAWREEPEETDAAEREGGRVGFDVAVADLDEARDERPGT